MKWDSWISKLCNTQVENYYFEIKKFFGKTYIYLLQIVGKFKKIVEILKKNFLRWHLKKIFFLKIQVKNFWRLKFVSLGEDFAG